MRIVDENHFMVRYTKYHSSTDLDSTEYNVDDLTAKELKKKAPSVFYDGEAGVWKDVYRIKFCSRQSEV